MPYAPIINGAPDLAAVCKVIWRLERYYLEPVNNLLRLPMPHYRLEANFHFVISQILLTAIAGASTSLYLEGRGDRAKFVGLVSKYYPWGDEPDNAIEPDRGALIFYEHIRCPVVHDLGINLKGDTHQIIVKALRAVRPGVKGLTWAGIRPLERRQRPLRMVPTLVERQDDTITLQIEPLYWGTRRLLERLTSDRPRMEKAAAYLAKFPHVG